MPDLVAFTVVESARVPRRKDGVRARVPAAAPPAALTLVASLLIAACTAQHASDRTPPTTPRVVTVSPAEAVDLYPTVSLSCAAGRPNVTRAQPIFEVAGQPAGAGLWALVFDPTPFYAGRQVKIAWHMTGTGPLSLSAMNLDTGQVVRPFNGPDVHSSSSWHRPGPEWGSTWVFPSQGCWRITATRSTATGSITASVSWLPE